MTFQRKIRDQEKKKEATYSPSQILYMENASVTDYVFRTGRDKTG